MPKFIVERRDRRFVDAHGITIHFYEWRSPRSAAVVQLAHGLGEYVTRYEHLAQELVNAGYTVYGNDHRGHGRTGLEQWQGDASMLGRLGPGGLRAVLGDLRQLTGIIRRENPDAPVVLLGHSLGSLMAQKLLNRHASDYSAAVLSGTVYRMPGHMNPGDLNKRHRALGTTGYEWLSRDAAVAEAFLDDPLTFTADVRRLFGIRDGLRLYGRPARRLPDLPLLIMIGSDDSLGGERSAGRLAEAYRRRSGLSDVQLRVYPDARHELFNELNRDDVIADLVGWLDTRTGASTGGHHTVGG